MLHYSPYYNSFFNVLFKDVQNHKVLADIEVKFNVIAFSVYLFINFFSTDVVRYVEKLFIKICSLRNLHLLRAPEERYGTVSLLVL
jgi:tyrosine-protein phosphatase YwqE